MSNGEGKNPWERLAKLWATVGKLLLDGNRTPEEVCEVLQAIVSERRNSVLTPILATWATFYRDYLGMEADLSSVVIPPHRPGYDRLIVIPQGLTMNAVITTMKKHFSVYLYTNDLDRDVPTNERDSKSGSYAVRVRDWVEADEENKNLSANQVKQLGLTTLTLLERLVYEFKYYSETKSHLDLSNVSLCSGSRSSGGGVPGVFWDDGRLGVGWCRTGRSDGRIRARAAVV